MADLMSFIRARMDEDKRAAQAGLHSHVVAMVARQSGKRNALNFWHRHDPARVLADVAAKRRIVDECEQVDNNAAAGPHEYGLAMAILRNLAAPHADHADYDPAWRP